MAHGNARLTVHGRTVLIERVLRDRRPVAHVAAELGISRATGYKWVARYRAEGPAGLVDRSSRAHRIPARTSPELELRVLALRRERKLGPHRIAPLVGLPASTVHAVLARHGVSRLAWMDRPSGQVIRRYERDRPGELIHVDVKKLGRLRDGGGWRVHGRDSLERRRARYGPRVGYDYVHAAIDDHTRLAYAEIHRDERAHTCAGFAARRGVLRRPRHRPDRTGHDRQRDGLSPITSMAGIPGPDRCRAPVHPPLPAPDQWQR